MDPDLLDLLRGVTSGEVAGARWAALMNRVRADRAFRLAAVGEVRLLGQLKAVQSTGPRWLSLEDEIGAGAAEGVPPVPLEDRVLKEILGRPRPRSLRWWPLAAVAACLLAGWGAAFLLWPEPAPPTVARSSPSYVAVLVKTDGVEWPAADGPAPAEGHPLPTGRLRLLSGRATMTMFSGVTLSVEGPADLDLTAADRIFCHRGKVRARVSPGGEGFVALAPGSAVVDLGTEFGLNVAADGKVDLMVFEGKAEVSVLNAEGHTLRSEVLEGRKAVTVDARAGRIREVPAAPEAFAAAPELVPPALRPDSGYPSAVRRSRPWGYWRFDALDGGAVRNEVADRPPLRATGPLALAGTPGGNRAVEFAPTREEQHLVMDDSWTPPRATGYAVEAWVLPAEVNMGTLVGLNARADEPHQMHAFLLELAGRGHHLVHEPCVVRVLDRWPPANAGGVNVFSRRMYAPYRWYHLVARRVPDRLELYMDGELAGTAPADPREPTTPCRLVVGRLRSGPQPDQLQTRAFVGRLDELAVYDHPLTPEDIRRHYRLGIAADRPDP